MMNGTLRTRESFAVAVVAPMTGANAAFGAQVRHGVALAAADFNASDNALGRSIHVQVYDDRSDINTGLSVAHNIIRDGITAVIGHSNSYISIPASELYAAAGTLQITPVSTHPLYTMRGLWNTFRTCGRDDQQAAILGAYLASHFHRCALVHDDTEYGLSLMSEISTALREASREPVLIVSLTRGQTQFDQIVNSIYNARADAVFFGGDPTEAGRLIRNIRRVMPSVAYFSADGIASATYPLTAGAAAEGTIISYSLDPREQEDARDVVARFRSQAIEPEGNTLHSYAALQVFTQAAIRVGSLDSHNIAHILHSGTSFDTVLGPLSFKQNGDLMQSQYHLYAWRKDAQGYIDYQGNRISS